MEIITGKEGWELFHAAMKEHLEKQIGTYQEPLLRGRGNGKGIIEQSIQPQSQDDADESEYWRPTDTQMQDFTNSSDLLQRRLDELTPNIEGLGGDSKNAATSGDSQNAANGGENPKEGYTTITIPFTVGQQVWAMEENKPHQMEVEAIEVKIGHTFGSITLRLSYTKKKVFKDSYEVFPTKEALLASL